MTAGARWTPFACVIFLASPASAQPATPWDRTHAGIAFGFADPTGPFQDFVDRGFGAAVHAQHGFGRTGLVGVRLDAAMVIYGHERQSRPLSETVRRVVVDVTTTNNIFSLGIGPQITLGGRALRLYGYGGVGLSYFATLSSAEGTGDIEPFATTTHLDDLTLSWYDGVGVLARVARGRRPVFIDAGVRHVRNGRARYLREGGVREGVNGNLLLTPTESEANLFLVHVGVSFALR